MPAVPLPSALHRRGNAATARLGQQVPVRSRHNSAYYTEEVWVLVVGNSLRYCWCFGGCKAVEAEMKRSGP